MNFGPYLTKAREMAYLTQQELAELCGVSQVAICRIEKGSINPSFQTLLKLMQLRHVQRAFEVFVKDQITVKRMKSVWINEGE